MANVFKLDSETNNLKCNSVDIFSFSDDYACGHQSGINLIMHDRRMINGGDIRLEQTPGQWQPVPALIDRKTDVNNNSITATLHYPDEKQHMKGFNPLIYPNVTLDYEIITSPYKDGVRIDVNLINPIPEILSGKASFIMEMYPDYMIGNSYLMDDEFGIFPAQPNGPTLSKKTNIDNEIYNISGGKANLTNLVGDRTYYSPMVADDVISMPYACGHNFTANPESDLYCFSIHSEDEKLKLYDGRMNHNNGWFVIASELPVDKTGIVLTWYLEPRVNKDYIYSPVIATSQVGYHPKQNKVAVIEGDRRENFENEAIIYKLLPVGKQKVSTLIPKTWGKMFRYNYATVDFSEINEEGLYQIKYQNSESSIFKISKNVFERGVWQPVIEYFLPVQMCHMLVREKYRTWHGLCHNDDAVMAPTDYNHIDGYYQGPDTLCKYKSGDHVPGLNAGGWHDAGDYDLRIESQSGEVYNLALAYEYFKPEIDTTTIDQDKHLVEIHLPDGKNDILQQIEHGLLTVIGGYEALGRLYRGIICRDTRQYVLLGDGSTMTDGIPSDDDRLVFTEDNPNREFQTAAHLAAAYRCMKGFNDELANKALKISIELYQSSKEKDHEWAKLLASTELLISTGEKEYADYLLSHTKTIKEHFGHIGWCIVKSINYVKDENFTRLLKECAINTNDNIKAECSKNPYGVPIHPRAWGAGWDVQGFGVRYYFLYKAFPDVFSPYPFINALNFVLGCHYGKNTASYASGVGTKSATTAYCANRADHSYIPGGVVSGTELIAPDFPEYLMSPFIWQQSEYVLGGGSSHYMFLVLAVKDFFN